MIKNVELATCCGYTGNIILFFCYARLKLWRQCKVQCFINPSAYLAVSETEAQHFYIAYPAVSETDFAHPWKCSYNFGQTWPKTIKQHSLNSWSFTLSDGRQLKSFCVPAKSPLASKCTIAFCELCSAQMPVFAVILCVVVQFAVCSG